MNACPLHASRAFPRGISLLEVLISIGILSVGLIGALSMIPVGRTYLTKAAVDDRAAAVIPAAYGELLAMGLMKENALSWVDQSAGPVPEGEETDPEGWEKPGSWTNNTRNDAVPLVIPFMDMVTIQNQVRLVRKSSLRVVGRRGVDWALKANAEPNEDGGYDVDAYVVHSRDEVDWFRIDRLEAGQVLTIRSGTLAEPPILYFNGSSIPLDPRASGPGFKAYAIPTDGNAFLEVRHAPVGEEPTPYIITLELTRPDRIVAVDPLMASRLDWILGAKGEAADGMTSLALRRRYFADFNQDTPAAQPRAFRIPRLSWQRLATPTLEQSVALADRICRMHDDLEVDDDVADARGSGRRDEFAPPRPVYARNAAGTALARQAVGRMSWLLTLQPQAAGSVADNWRAGSMFDASIVIFQDRALPKLDVAATVDGEYTFAAWWDPLQGVIFVEVPQPFVLNGEEIYLDEEDLRFIFRTGSWMLLAPRIANNASPIDDRQRLAWVRAQMVEMEKLGSSVAVTVLPMTEPPPDLVLGTPDAAGRIPLVVMVHQGVVAVVTKQIKVQGP